MIPYLTRTMSRIRNEYLCRVVICPFCYRQYDLGKRICNACNVPLITVDEGIEDLLVYFWEHGITTLYSCAGMHKRKPSLPNPAPSGTEDGAPYFVFKVPQIATDILGKIIGLDCTYYAHCFSNMMMEPSRIDGTLKGMLYGYDVGDTIEYRGKKVTLEFPNLEDFKGGCITLLHEIIATVFTG